ncbi:MAG: GWxTD domain-containing protein [Candidatus Sulfotelmatobacter sp.]
MSATRFHNSPILLLLMVWFPVSIPAHSQNTGRVPEGIYKNRLDQDVRWIISDQERADFKKLSDDTERVRFVVEFWERRNPDPGASTNSFKEKHYRRLAYVDQHFSEDVPGWKTDRGRVYVMWGPPDGIERRSRFEGSQANGLPRQTNSEEWRSSYIEGLGCDVVIEFEASGEGGEYYLTARHGEFRPRWKSSPDCLIEQILFP